MIKKLQALKAKKGFTLVELVVVIAIIGVLAAILIPTLIGVVQDANITSADSAANTLRTLATTFVTNASNLHKSTLQTEGTGVTVVTFTVTNGTWAHDTGDLPQFGDGKKVFWAVGDDSNAGATPDKDTHFDTYMNEEARDVKNGYVAIALQKGAVVGLAVRLDSTEPFTIEATDWTNGYTATLFPDKGGVTETNQIIGTNPKLGSAKQAPAAA